MAERRQGRLPEPHADGPQAPDTDRPVGRPARWRLSRRYRWSRGSLISLSVLLILGIAAVLAPYIAPYGPTTQSTNALLGPGGEHWLGTDALGRDLASRLLYGARVSLLVALSSASLAAVVGVPIGLVTGYFGGWADSVAMRIIDVILAVPGVLFALLIVTLLGSQTPYLVMAIALLTVPAFARLARASTLAVKENDYVHAAKTMGADRPDIMFRTILPNILSPITVQFIVSASLAIVIEAGLSYLGLGIPPPTPTWGGMLRDAQSYLFQNPWYAVFPGVALTLTVLCLDGVGRGLQAKSGVSLHGAVREVR